MRLIRRLKYCQLNIKQYFWTSRHIPFIINEQPSPCALLSYAAIYFTRNMHVISNINKIFEMLLNACNQLLVYN